MPPLPDDVLSGMDTLALAKALEAVFRRVLLAVLTPLFMDRDIKLHERFTTLEDFVAYALADHEKRYDTQLADLQVIIENDRQRRTPTD